MKLLLWACGAASLAGCGYSVGGMVEHPSVYVPIFDTKSERRGAEFDLLRATADELKKNGVDVNDPAAPVELKGVILDITEPSRVEGEGDVVVVGAVAFKVEITLVSRPEGREISKWVLEESASFSSGRSETRDTARREVITRIARRVVTLLWKDW
ncbi:MAG TPA: LPS assembly lipoprotein LptE [Planctomycetota bacterium]|nr:LPS assembly lipoprotein LptE [Planctomycetota bacterium]